VPAIIDQDIWNRAQQRARRNKKLSGKRVNEYLLTSRVRCGLCGSNMMGRCVNLKGYKKYLYYVCQASRKDEIANKTCNLPAFRVDVYDAMVWEYFIELLSDPAKFQAGLDAYRRSLANHNSPLQVRLAAVDELLEEYRKKLARLLDLYLGGDFEKDMLVDHKKRLDDTIRGLENERESLQATIERRILTPERIATIQEFAANVRRGFEAAASNICKKQQLLDLLDVEATLTIENGEKMLYLRYALGEDILPVTPSTCGSCRCKSLPRLHPGRPGPDQERGRHLPGSGCLPPGRGHRAQPPEWSARWVR
jgi:hypothetical protein